MNEGPFELVRQNQTLLSARVRPPLPSVGSLNSVVPSWSATQMSTVTVSAGVTGKFGTTHQLHGSDSIHMKYEVNCQKPKNSSDTAPVPRWYRSPAKLSSPIHSTTAASCWPVGTDAGTVQLADML